MISLACAILQAAVVFARYLQLWAIEPNEVIDLLTEVAAEHKEAAFRNIVVIKIRIVNRPVPAELPHKIISLA